jgi:phosphoglycolate phosphatase
MVIYDCDGVIFNSEKANFHYYNHIFKNFALPEIKDNDVEAIKVLHSYCNDDVLKYFIKKEKLLKDAINFSRKVDYKMFYPYMKIEDGFFKTCKKLKEKGFKVAVATNRSYTFKDIVDFFKLDAFIDDYVTALHVEKPKPFPDMLNFLLKKHNFKNNEAIFVGDSILDYEAAKNASVDFVGYKFKMENCKFINSHVEIFNFL